MRKLKSEDCPACLNKLRMEIEMEFWKCVYCGAELWLMDDEGTDRKEIHKLFHEEVREKSSLAKKSGGSSSKGRKQPPKSKKRGAWLFET